MTLDTPLSIFDTNVIPPLNGDGPRVRRSDPITSHEAADSNDVYPSQTYVFDLLWLLGPSTDHELVAAAEKEFAQHPGMDSWTPQRIRSARNELKNRGLAEFTGEYRPSPTGRRAQVWRVVR